jgi:protein-tyrosine phosphatase
LRILIVGIATVAALVLIWEEIVKYRVIAKRWGVVVPGRIYRSGQISKWVLPRKLQEHGIEVVVDLTNIVPDDIHQQAEIATLKRLGIEHHRFRLTGDGSGDIQNYANAIGMLAECEQAGRPVLVHCAAGAQRTGGVVAAYRVLVRGELPRDAYAELSRYGWKAHKDQRLLTYLNGHMRELAQLLVERGVIDSVPDPLPVVGP